MKTITSKTPCPNCGGHEWNAYTMWASYMPLRWTTHLASPRARAMVDWDVNRSEFMDSVMNVDECVTCGAVVS